MKSAVFYSLVFLTLLNTSHAEDISSDEEISAEAPTHQREKWRKAMRETDGDWSKAKDAYLEGMTRYYQAGMVVDHYRNASDLLAARITVLDQQINIKKPEGLNSATNESWNRKIANLKLELKGAQDQLSAVNRKKTEAEAVLLKSPDPNQLDQELNKAGLIAHYNADANDKKKIKRGQKILNETNSDGVELSTLNSIRRKAADAAIVNFQYDYPEDQKTNPRLTQKTSFAQTQVQKVDSDGEGSADKNSTNPKTVTVTQTDTVTSTQTTTVQNTATATETSTSTRTETATTTSTETKTETASTSETSTATESAVEVVKVDPAPSAEECDKARAEIIRLLLASDQYPKAYSDMVYMAQLKMAYRLSAEKNLTSKSIESFAAAKGISKAAQAASANASLEFKKSLESLYEKYGEKQDLEKVTLLKTESPDYKKARLNNDSASAVILYLSQTEPKDSTLGFSPADAAAVWAQQKLRSSYKPTSKTDPTTGLLNFSTGVCRMFKDKSGICSGPQEKPPVVTEDSMKSAYEALYKKFSESVQKAAQSAKFDPKMQKCFASCEKDKPLTLGASDIEDIKAKLAELVGKGRVDGLNGSVEVDPKKTTGKNGNLTIYLKKSE